MTRFHINGSDRLTVTLLHLDLPAEAVERFASMAGTGEWPLKYALGAERLREGFVEVIDLRDLGPMPLSQYLADAHDLSPKVLGADKARIDTLTGHVVVLPAQAFDATSQDLNIAMPLSLVGRYGAPAPRARGAMLQSDSARGQGAGGTPAPTEGLAGWVKITLIALAALVVVILALVL